PRVLCLTAEAYGRPGPHSISTLSSLSFLPQKLCSLATNLANSARVRSGGSSSPSLLSASSHLGSFIAALVCCSILSSTASGVLAGANRPCQLVPTTSMPCSLSVGTSGNDFPRFSPVTASALRLPALICPTAGGREEKFMVIWPEITSASAGPVPLYGTCVSLMPAASANSAPARWLLPPTPDDEKVSFSGSFLASATSSAAVLAATLGLIASTY